VTTAAIEPPAPRPLDIEAIRAQFPILQELGTNGEPIVYLDNAASSQKPLAVIDALDHYYRTDHANVHRGVHLLSRRATEAYEAARVDVQRFMNAGSDDEIVFTRGTTEGLNLVASSWSAFLQPGDEILLTHLEHHSNIVPWQLAAQRSGATIKVLPVHDDGSVAMEQLDTYITDRTRVVSVSHISNALGTVLDVKRIAEAAHAAGAIVVVDGAQSAPHEPIDVQALDADFYVFSGHKIYGPTGIGALYGKAALLDKMPPWQGGGEMIDTVTFEGSTWAPAPAKFEAGTPNIAGAVGLGAACRWMLDVGVDAIKAHEASLLDYVTPQVEAMDKVRIVGTAPGKAGVLSFVVDGLHPHDIGTLLDEQGVAVRTGHHCTQPLMRRMGVDATARASLAVYNTTAELDRFVAALDKTVRLFS
jgi:cysteine desulfurase/selenocysteine lyase